MAAPNVTGDGQHKTIEDLFCSSDLSAGLHGHLTILSVLNSFLSVTAFLGNALILIALRKESSLHPPSKLLLRCLATTSFITGYILCGVSVGTLAQLINYSLFRCLATTSFITGYILCGVSVGTLAQLSVDRLLALLLGLRYRQVVTLKRTLLPFGLGALSVQQCGFGVPR